MSGMPASQPYAPDASVTSFDGKPIPANRDFFGPPPPEIGRVLCCESTLRIGKDRKGLFRVLFESLAIAAVVAGLLTYLASQGNDPNPTVTFVLMWIVFTPIVGAVVFGFSGFRHECCYVADAGIAILSLTGRRSATIRSQVLLFAEAEDSLSSHSVGDDTNRSIKWRNARGDTIFSVETTHSSMDFTKRSSQRLRFMNAAESVWSQFVFRVIQATWATESWIEFRMTNPAHKITLAPGSLRIEFNGKTDAELAATDIKSVKLSQGLFRIAPHTGKDHHLFPYNDTGNACVLMAAIDQLLFGRPAG